jgi:alpha-glucosidase
VSAEQWWRDAVLYHVYLRSYQDGDGDGVGDLRGLLSRLDHLAWLGVGAVWLSPVNPSPDADWGYDVSDYLGIHPALGTQRDLDAVLEEAGRRGIRVLLDLVPNHTSDRHPWFRDPARRDWYVWTDRPNNWLSHFGGPAWTYDESVGRHYLHSFLPEQPDLNWWNPEVRDEFDAILRHWFDRGVAGFRIDVCHAIVKDRLLRDNPPAGPEDGWLAQRRGQVFLYNENRPEVHEVLRRWRRIAEEHQPPRVLLGETYLMDLGQVAAFYGRGDELQLALNFPFLFSAFEAVALRQVVAATEAALGPSGWPAWCASSHDASRFPTRWAGGREDAARCALMLLLTLRGTPLLYYGDEIGMTDVPVPPERVRDRFRSPSRDPERTPMQWTAGPNAGFTDPGAEPWLPVGDPAARNVADQASDPGSTLSLCRDLIAYRRRLGAGQELLEGPPGVWLHRRGDHLVALNLGDDGSVLEGVEGAVGIATRREREGLRLAGRLELEPWEGVVVESGRPARVEPYA